MHLILKSNGSSRNLHHGTSDRGHPPLATKRHELPPLLESPFCAEIDKETHKKANTHLQLETTNQHLSRRPRFGSIKESLPSMTTTSQQANQPRSTIPSPTPRPKPIPTNAHLAEGWNVPQPCPDTKPGTQSRTHPLSQPRH
jgi:hypothetical protein